MPAMLDDPTAPAIYRVSGEAPYPTPFAPLPAEITARQVTLKDRLTTATLVPFSAPDQVPAALMTYLAGQFNREIEGGDTYPMLSPLAPGSFGPYWFANFGAVMLLGEVDSVAEVWKMEHEGTDWAKRCLGSFYVKPNYPGRSSHVCNGGFLVTDAARNRGVGRMMGEGYLEWAPKLGYTYSVFNLVYETNVASLRIWDALGFKRIGRVKDCGNLKSHPDRLVDAIIFGRDLNGEAEDYLTEERFDKIRYYLKTAQYPAGSDRAEKSRLRSASAHYRLEPGTEANSGEERLMLKGKQVISDPQKQYEIAHKMHAQAHGGINKTTAAIAEKYHWVRIKETVSTAIRYCGVCKEAARPMPSKGESSASRASNEAIASLPDAGVDGAAAGGAGGAPQPYPAAAASPLALDHAAVKHSPMPQTHAELPQVHPDAQERHPIPIADMGRYHYELDNVPVDPQIMEGIRSYAGAAEQQRQQQQQQHLVQYEGFGMTQGYERPEDVADAGAGGGRE